MLCYKHDRVSRVAPIFYMESALALVFDIAIFKVQFTPLQIVGLAIIITSFAVIILTAYLSDEEKTGSSPSLES